MTGTDPKSHGLRLGRRAVGKLSHRAGDLYYGMRTRQAPRVLIYTDSRGYDVVSRSRTASYVALLRKRYRVAAVVCPERYTTILDFLTYMEKVDRRSYDVVVLHCGVVDFSPRPVSGLQKMRTDKQGNLRFQAAMRDNAAYHEQMSDTQYEGERTTTLYSRQYLVDVLIPELKQFERLIWISSNHFVPGWDGNYTRGRPNNIDEVVSGYDCELSRALPVVVDLKSWTNDEIRQYTVDNIHFSNAGFRCVARRLESKIESSDRTR